MRRTSTFIASGLVACSIVSTLLAQSVVRTADPIKRGLQADPTSRARSKSPTTSTPTKTSTPAPRSSRRPNMFVVTDAGVLVADGQGSARRRRKGLVDAISKVTDQADQIVVIARTTAITPPATPRFPAGVHYIIHPTSKAILDRQAAAPNARADAWKLPADAELVVGQEDDHDGRRGSSRFSSSAARTPAATSRSTCRKKRSCS